MALAFVPSDAVMLAVQAGVIAAPRRPPEIGWIRRLSGPVWAIIPIASIVGVIRAGHTSEEKSGLVQALWKMFQDKTGVSDRELSVALQEVPASQAMENGVIMPEVAH